MALGVRVGLAVPEGLAVVVAEAVELPAEPEALKEDVLEAVEELVAVKLPVPDTEGELDAEAVLVELAVPVLVEVPVELGVLVLDTDALRVAAGDTVGDTDSEGDVLCVDVLDTVEEAVGVPLEVQLVVTVAVALTEAVAVCVPLPVELALAVLAPVGVAEAVAVCVIEGEAETDGEAELEPLLVAERSGGGRESSSSSSRLARRGAMAEGI